MIRELISYRHELQHRLVSLSHLRSSPSSLAHAEDGGSTFTTTPVSLPSSLTVDKSRRSISIMDADFPTGSSGSSVAISNFTVRLRNDFLDGIEDACPFLPHDTLVMQFEESILRSGRLDDEEGSRIAPQMSPVATDDGYFSLTVRSSA